MKPENDALAKCMFEICPNDKNKDDMRSV